MTRPALSRDTENLVYNHIMKQTPSTFARLQDPAVQRIMDVARQAGGEARVVGGAVRDALMGRTVGEIDFACTLPPDALTSAMKQAGIKTVPTGIEHGTITVVIDGTGYEVTTLRHDVETDGRRAKVAFTDDWQADAARRDFTMNALYVDADGKIYDYFDGQKDLAARHVRFIGDAEARIHEDVLRILRFFRFTAWFGRETDAGGLKACRALAELIPQLSIERIWREIVKLLNAENPLPIWRLMLESGVLAQFMPEASDIARLQALLEVEKLYEKPPSSLRRLAALLHPPITAIAVSERLKLSKRETAKLMQLTTLPALLVGKLDPVPFRHAIYEHGAVDTADAALLCNASQPELDLDPALAAAAEWDNPRFPLQGQDLLKLGMQAGPAMGAALKELEDQWIASDFKLSRDELLMMAGKKLPK